MSAGAQEKSLHDEVQRSETRVVRKSLSISPQDVLNQKLLGIRLKKERESQRRREKAALKNPVHAKHLDHMRHPTAIEIPAIVKRVQDPDEIKRLKLLKSSKYEETKYKNTHETKVPEASLPLPPVIATPNFLARRQSAKMNEQELKFVSKKITSSSSANEPSKNVQETSNSKFPERETAAVPFRKPEIRPTLVVTANQQSISPKPSSPMPVVHKISTNESLTVLQFTEPSDWLAVDNSVENDDVWTIRSDTSLKISNRARDSKPQQYASSAMSILRIDQDESKYITLIPADESKILDVEINRWNSDRSSFCILLCVVIALGVIIAVATACSAAYYVLHKGKATETSKFLLHSDLMIVSSTAISATGILLFRILPSAKIQIVARGHAAIFVAMYVIFIGASCVAFNMHEMATTRREHLYSMHAMIGIMIMGFLIVETITGIFAMCKPDSAMGSYHGAIGIATFLLCCVGCVSGYVGRSITFDDPLNSHDSLMREILTNVTAVLIIIFCCLVRYLATEYRFRRRSCPQWDTIFRRRLSSEDEINASDHNISLDKYVRLSLRHKIV